ncbi:hypothetical protein ACHAWF_013406 [Thalassiosira exigua]
MSATWTGIAFARQKSDPISPTATDPLLSMFNTANIGRLGSNPLAALGVCTSIFYMSFYGFLATKTATTTLVASAQSDDEASLVTSTSLQLGIAADILVMTGLRLFGRQALGAMGVPEWSDIFPHALTYLNTRCLSAPFFLLITVAEGALRGYGDTKIPLLASAATAATMVALEPFLMFVLGWKIRGAAAALWEHRKLRGPRCMPISFDEEIDKRRAREGERQQTTATYAILLSRRYDHQAGQPPLYVGMCNQVGDKAWRRARCSTSGRTKFLMVFAYVLDAVSVGAQVLFSKARKSVNEMRSITRYMLSVAVAQGLFITLIIAGLSSYVPGFFTQDEAVIAQLRSLMPVLSMQQILISLTFVMEALAAGGSQFSLLGMGTALSALTAVVLLRRAESVLEIWTGGVLAMFVGRLIAATLGVLNANSLLPKLRRGMSTTEKME